MYTTYIYTADVYCMDKVGCRILITKYECNSRNDPECKVCSEQAGKGVYMEHMLWLLSDVAMLCLYMHIP